MNDQARALLFVAALFGGGGYTGGRVTAPAPEPEVRFVHIPMPAIMAPQIDVAPVELAPVPASPATVPTEPDPVAAAPAAEPKPLPRPRPKVEVKPKPRPEKKRAASHSTRGMPSCAVVKREYDAMGWPERMAAYRKATPEEIAHGKRCLGF